MARFIRAPKQNCTEANSFRDLSMLQILVQLREKSSKLSFAAHALQKFSASVFSARFSRAAARIAVSET
jgi:hypothetical protein